MVSYHNTGFGPGRGERKQPAKHRVVKDARQLLVNAASKLNNYLTYCVSLSERRLECYIDLVLTVCLSIQNSEFLLYVWDTIEKNYHIGAV